MIKKHWQILAIITLFCNFSYAQKTYKITVPLVQKAIQRGHLNLGGTNINGRSVAFNSYYMLLDDKPFIPVMGEFHYARFPREQWEEQILKIKAGGINVIASYVFWSLHEPRENEWRWEGNRDLRAFATLCRDHDIDLIVRIGPYGHGEIRNGAIPDWIYGRPFEIRSNDHGYLFYAKRLYQNIAAQLKGLYFNDGGPIIGIQLENELQHSASPWSFNYAGLDREYTVANYDNAITQIGVSVQNKLTDHQQYGTDHLATLKKIAKDAGMDVPLYTVTGWGNAAVLENEAIPVTAAYPYPFWAEPELSPFYLFKDIQLEPDYSPVRYDGRRYPSFCAEMGAGIQITYARRPQVLADAAEALMLRSLGSGANGIGYYMYHGGLTPYEDGIFYSDEPMGVPKISYDFQAPIGEYGKVRDSYFQLRLIHLFTAHFGNLLAPMDVVLPETNAQITPDDITTLRYAVRSNGQSGFVFMHNFQDHSERQDQQIGGLRIRLEQEDIQFPAFQLKKDVSVILPFNLSIAKACLKYSTAQPLAITETDSKKHYIFYAHSGIDVQYAFDPTSVQRSSLSGHNNDAKDLLILRPTIGLTGTFTVVDQEGEEVLITTLTREQALGFNQVNGQILITEATVVADRTGLQLQSRSPKFHFTLLGTDVPTILQGKPVHQENGLFNTYVVELPPADLDYTTTEVSKQRYTFHMDSEQLADHSLSDIILQIDYVGDTGTAFFDGKMINDHLYYGTSWEIGLKQYADQLKAGDLYFYFKPMKKDASYLIDFEKDKVPDFSHRTSVCDVRTISVIPEYKLDITIKK